MDRFRIIDHILASRRGRDLLQIVHATGDPRGTVSCTHTTGPDQNPVTTFIGPADAFFAGNSATFDAIFIDGLHVEDQVARDIAHANSCLAPGGAIVLHDCLPPDEWYQREPEEVRLGEAWTGAVWKAVLREFNSVSCRCFIVDDDWGCGVIDTGRNQTPTLRPLPVKLDYDQHYKLLGEYVIGVPEFLREQVSVFFHLACLSGWRDVFGEQLQLIANAGFGHLTLGLVGSDADLRSALDLCAMYGISAEPVIHTQDLKRYETPTILAVERHARDHDGYVLYLHSKGVSDPTSGVKAAWRRLMMDELVVKWEQVMPELPDYDAVGVNWRDMGRISHFSGNFWYASTSYLRRLPDFHTYYHQPRYAIPDPISDKRLGCEFWIGAADMDPRILSLVCRNSDFCHPSYWSRHERAIVQPRRRA